MNNQDVTTRSFSGPTTRRIVLACHSDLLGGAAIATYRLMNALREAGNDATMLVINKLSDDPNVHRLGTRLGAKSRFLAERAYIFSHNRFNRADLFKVSVANTGYDISKHTLVRQADTVILSWINQGMMSLKDIDRLLSTGKRVIWVMHDMWCMTGICHHALDCTNYTGDCGNCRFLGPGKSPGDISHRVWLKKNSLYSNHRSLEFIAVSSWLRDRAKESTLLSRRDVRVISNPFPFQDFYTSPRSGYVHTGIDTSRRLIIMGAARLDDPIKDFPLAVEALNKLAEERPDIANGSQAVFYGNLREPAILEKLRFPHVWIGSITDHKELAELFSRGTIVLSTSRFETLGMTLIEGLASGCIAVSTDGGGQRDIITHGVNGYLTDHTAASISAALAAALDTQRDREAQRLSVTRRFSAPAIAAQITM